MNSSRTWVLRVDPSVGRALKRMPWRDAEAILDAVRQLPVNPYLGDIQKMKGERDVWRRRIGSYRIFYKLKTKERAILVFRVERRTSKTY